MENQEVSPKQIMLNYGLMLGFASILISVALYAMGKTYDPHWSVGVFSTLITVVVIILGIKKIKELNGGFLSLSEALKTGLGIALVSGLIFVVYNLIFVTFIEPEYFARMLEVQQQKMLETYPNFSDEQLEASSEMAKKMSGPFINSAIIVIGSLFLGFVISLIGGLIMKKSDEEITSI
ncbi:MAG: DUF4199 domain-containing protein [Bacteroidetes bacterium HGW-Bacteroidetes-3]|jgi:hypothetical protein|nr:MAG: DUF4199 domain-containing protein [Bacteroidetes bacterium HGW-Bacteroidetes-3]